MKDNINCILLIDDDESVNFLHKCVIDAAKITRSLLIAETAQQALNLLKDSTNGKRTKPDIIFLDLNMPKMDGWKFIEEYKKIENKDDMPFIAILSSSANPDDRRKAEGISEVGGFYNKPLTKKLLGQIVDQYQHSHKVN